MIRVISLGAGVQSTTLALMAAHGEIDSVDCAIFADTQWEPRAVYYHLDWLREILPFPVHIVTNGTIREDAIGRTVPGGHKFAAIPWYTDKGMGRRQCTKDYKLRPIHRKVVELLGGKRPKGGCEMLIGISWDEAQRAKESRVKYIVNRWPLLEKGMNRNACLAWLDKHGYPKPPKSACIGCPFHNNAQWRSLTPEEFQDAVEVDRAIRDQGRVKQYMHSSKKPLEEIDFRTLEDMGQMNLFNQECEGMCGV